LELYYLSETSLGKALKTPNLGGRLLLLISFGGGGYIKGVCAIPTLFFTFYPSFLASLKISI
jgi:hypothetical protein